MCKDETESPTVRNLRRIKSRLAELTITERPVEVVEWCRQNIILTARHGSRFVGAYDPYLTPYVVDILRDIDNPSVRRVVLMFGAQTGKTQVMLAALARWLACDPAPTMIVQPNEYDAGVFGETRIKPMLEDSPTLCKLVPADRRDNYQKMLYKLPGALVYLIGAGSPAKMASKPIRYAVLDEVDKYPTDYATEGDPLELIAQRLKTYAGQEKIIISSTPTIPTGTINRAYAEGDCRELETPCAACGARFRLAWDNVRWAHDCPPAEAAKSARLRCPICGAEYSDADKPRLVRAARWTATREAIVPGTVSYHLQSLCAPWVTLAGLVTKWLASDGNPTAQRAFVNSELAEVWRDSAEIVHAGQLVGREGDYPAGGHFAGLDELDSRMRVGGVDVQRDELVAVVREFATDGASGLVAKARLPSFAELAAWLRANRADYCLIDSQYRTAEVVAACAAYPDCYLHPAYGRRKMPGVGIVVAKPVPVPSGGTVEQYGYDQSYFFGLVVDGIRAAHNAPPWWIFRGAADDRKYIEEVTAKTFSDGYWHADSATADHYGDAEKLTMVGAYLWGYLTAPAAQSEETPPPVETPDNLSIAPRVD